MNPTTKDKEQIPNFLQQKRTAEASFDLLSSSLLKCSLCLGKTSSQQLINCRECKDNPICKQCLPLSTEESLYLCSKCLNRSSDAPIGKCSTCLKESSSLAACNKCNGLQCRECLKLSDEGMQLCCNCLSSPNEMNAASSQSKCGKCLRDSDDLIKFISMVMVIDYLKINGGDVEEYNTIKDKEMSNEVVLCQKCLGEAMKNDLKGYWEMFGLGDIAIKRNNVNNSSLNDNNIVRIHNDNANDHKEIEEKAEEEGIKSHTISIVNQDDNNDSIKQNTSSISSSSLLIQPTTTNNTNTNINNNHKPNTNTNSMNTNPNKVMFHTVPQPQPQVQPQPQQPIKNPPIKQYQPSFPPDKPKPPTNHILFKNEQPEAYRQIPHQNDQISNHIQTQIEVIKYCNQLQTLSLKTLTTYLTMFEKQLDDQSKLNKFNEDKLKNMMSLQRNNIPPYGDPARYTNNPAGTSLPYTSPYDSMMMSPMYQMPQPMMPYPIMYDDMRQGNSMQMHSMNHK